MSTIETNLQGVYQARDAAIAGRRATFSAPVIVVAVSKSKPLQDVQSAIMAGQRVFGENYVQEGMAKIHALAELGVRGVEWHLIGSLQSNKAKLAAQHFDWVQTVDRLSIAAALSRHRLANALSPLNVLLQINVSHEQTKHGVVPAALPALADAVASLPALRLRGLMAITENTPDEMALRGQFRQMCRLFDALARRHPGVDTLSMGMSADFAIAIDEGSTMARVGSRIFGPRSQSVVQLQSA